MASPLDRYLQRATQGLPEEARLEAAAELRTHLLERAAALEAEGFSREEAEHLAVRAMGDPGPVNRGLVGHLFTYRLGWWVAAVLLLGVAAWWVADDLLNPPRVRQVNVSGGAAEALLAHPYGARLGLPRGARGVYLAAVYADGAAALVLEPERSLGPAALRRRVQLTVGTTPTSDACREEDPAALPILLDGAMRTALAGFRASSTACYRPPDGFVGGRWVHLPPARARVPSDSWLPLAVFRPTVTEVRANPADPADRYPRTVPAAPETWLALYLWVGKANAWPEPFPPPGLAALQEAFPRVFDEEGPSSVR